MATIATLSINLVGNASGLKSALTDAQQSIRATADNLKSVGTRMSGAISAPLVGFASLAVTTAGDFQQAMANVNAVANGTKEDLASLTSAAEMLGRTTSFSASEAAEGMSFLAMAGFKTNQIIAAMPGLLSTAAAGNTDLGTTADIVSNILSGFNVAAEDTGRVADILTKTFTSSNTDLRQLGDAMKYVAPVSASLGVSMENSATAIGFMSDAGIQASMAGTALRSILLGITAPTKRASDLMKELGINVFDSQGNLKDMPSVLAAFDKGLAGMSDAQRTASLEVVVGREAVSGFLALMSRGPDEFATFSQGLTDSAGTAETVAAKQLDTFQGQIKLMKSALEGLMIAVGDAILPTLTAIVVGVTPFISRLAEMFEGLSPSTQRMALIFAVVAAAAGPLIVGLGFVVGAVANLAPVIGILGGALGALLSPLGLVAAGLAAAFYFDVGGIRSQFNEVVAAVGDSLPEIQATIADLFSNGLSGLDLGSAFTGLQESLATVGETIMAAWGTLVDFFGPSIARLLESVGTMFSGFGELGPTFAALGDAIMGAVSALAPVVEFLGVVIAGALGVVAVVAINTLAAVFEALPGIVAATVAGVTAVINLIADVVSGMVQIVTSLLQGDFTGAWEGLKTVVGGVFDFIVAAVSNWGTVLGEAFGLVRNIIVGTFADLASALGLEGALAAVTAFKDNLVAIFSGEIFGAAMPVWLATLVGWMWPTLPVAPGWLTTLLTWMWPVFIGQPGWLATLMGWLWPAFIGQPGWLSRLMGWMWPTFPSAPGWLSNLFGFQWPTFPSAPAWLTNLNPFGGADTGNNALGTQYWRGGATWVGEGGQPELLNLPRGTRITPQSQVAGGGGGVTVVIQSANIRNESDVHDLAYRIDDIRRRRR